MANIEPGKYHLFPVQHSNLYQKQNADIVKIQKKGNKLLISKTLLH